MLSHIRPVFIRAGYQLRRCFSSSSEFVKVEKDEDGMAVMSLNRPPVNSLNLELLTEIDVTLQQLAKDKCQGIVLTSESKTVFSAGLDIKEMYKPNLDRARKFWSQLQDTWLRLYTFPFPVAAAINGHSPAGGCLLALSCEYRIMVGPKYTIGLNETQLGIIAPHWFQECMRNVIGTRQAEMALICGKLFSTDEASKIGLVDEVVETKEEAIARAKEYLEQQTYLPGLARNMTKQYYRRELPQWLAENKEADIKQFLDFVTQPKVQQGLEMYLAALKK